MKHAALLALLLLTTAVLVGCRTKGKATIEYDRPLPPGQLALRKITDPNELPDFTRAWRDLDSLEAAVQNSLSYLAKPSSEQYFPYGDVNHDRVVKSLETFLTLVESGILSTEINGLIRAYFDVYESVGCDNRGTVLFTAGGRSCSRATTRRSSTAPSSARGGSAIRFTRCLRIW